MHCNCVLVCATASLLGDNGRPSVGSEWVDNRLSWMNAGLITSQECWGGQMFASDPLIYIYSHAKAHAHMCTHAYTHSQTLEEHTCWLSIWATNVKPIGSCSGLHFQDKNRFLKKWVKLQDTNLIKLRFWLLFHLKVKSTKAEIILNIWCLAETDGQREELFTV